MTMLVEYLSPLKVNELDKEVLKIPSPKNQTWSDSIINYLKEGKLPADKLKARKMRY